MVTNYLTQDDTRNTTAQFMNGMSSCSNADVPPVRAAILTQVCKALENARQVGVREDHPCLTECNIHMCSFVYRLRTTAPQRGPILQQNITNPDPPNSTTDSIKKQRLKELVAHNPKVPESNQVCVVRDSMVAKVIDIVVLIEIVIGIIVILIFDAAW